MNRGHVAPVLVPTMGTLACHWPSRHLFILLLAAGTASGLSPEVWEALREALSGKHKSSPS